MKKIIVKVNQGQIEEFGRWLEEKLFLKRIENPNFVYKNGNCLLEICAMETVLSEEGFYEGFAHIALDSSDIYAALQYCQKEKLSLELEGEDIFLNPRVYGEGAYYFNIISPFGIVFEISQRKDYAGEVRKPVIAGINHMGLQVTDIHQTLQDYQEEGYKSEFEIVVNEDSTGNAVQVIMMKKDNIVVEIFQIEGISPCSNKRIFVEK